MSLGYNTANIRIQTDLSVKVICEGKLYDWPSFCNDYSIT
jgi:hypothetical protein